MSVIDFKWSHLLIEQEFELEGLNDVWNGHHWDSRNDLLTFPGCLVTIESSLCFAVKGTSIETVSVLIITIFSIIDNSVSAYYLTHISRPSLIVTLPPKLDVLTVGRASISINIISIVTSFTLCSNSIIALCWRFRRLEDSLAEVTSWSPSVPTFAPFKRWILAEVNPKQRRTRCVPGYCWAIVQSCVVRLESLRVWVQCCVDLNLIHGEVVPRERSEVDDLQQHGSSWIFPFDLVGGELWAACLFEFETRFWDCSVDSSHADMMHPDTPLDCCCSCSKDWELIVSSITTHDLHQRLSHRCSSTW